MAAVTKNINIAITSKFLTLFHRSCQKEIYLFLVMAAIFAGHSFESGTSKFKTIPA
jgi:hypothetical protein